VVILYRKNTPRNLLIPLRFALYGVYYSHMPEQAPVSPTCDKVTPTADLIAYVRGLSDIPYARETSEWGNVSSIAAGFLQESGDEGKILAVMAESRFKRISLQAQDYRHILELAVGRSPRGLIFTADPKVNYVATDLPDSLTTYRALMDELMGRHNLKRPNLQFAAVDAFSRDDISKAASLLPGGKEPMAVVSEGMMVYFDMDEKRRFLSNLHALFSIRPGILITSDVRLGQEARLAKILQTTAQISGRDMLAHTFKDEPAAQKFFGQCGFDARPVLDKVDITTMRRFKLENDPRAQSYANRPIWMLSPSRS